MYFQSPANYKRGHEQTAEAKEARDAYFVVADCSATVDILATWSVRDVRMHDETHEDGHEHLHSVEVKGRPIAIDERLLCWTRAVSSSPYVILA